MPDSVREQTTIAAPPEAVLAVLLDLESYPSWARGLKEATVLSRDEEGRAHEVRFRAAGMGYSTSYTLAYDHGTPGRLSWVLVEGEHTRVLDGSYELRDAGNGSTDVTYELAADLVVPLPGFIKRRTQHKITHTALRELKVRVEGQGE